MNECTELLEEQRAGSHAVLDHHEEDRITRSAWQETGLSNPALSMLEVGGCETSCCRVNQFLPSAVPVIACTDRWGEREVVGLQQHGMLQSSTVKGIADKRGSAAKVAPWPMTRFVFPWQSGSHYKYSTDKVGMVLCFLVFVVLAFAGRSMAFVTSSLNISLFSVVPLKFYSQLSLLS